MITFALCYLLIGIDFALEEYADWNQSRPHSAYSLPGLVVGYAILGILWLPMKITIAVMLYKDRTR